MQDENIAPAEEPVQAPPAEEKRETTPVEAPASPAVETPVAETPPPPAENPSLPSQGEGSIVSNLLARAREKIRFRKRKKLDKILELARAKQTIKNDDVEKFLRVSDKTAERYLNQLVKEGKLVREGHPKHALYRLP